MSTAACDPQTCAVASWEPHTRRATTAWVQSHAASIDQRTLGLDRTFPPRDLVGDKRNSGVALDDLSLSNTQLGLAFSAFAYPYALFQLMGGYFGEKFGPRLTLCVCSLIVCVAATGVVGGFASPFCCPTATGPR